MAFLAPLAIAGGSAVVGGLVNKIGKELGIFKKGGRVPRTGNYRLHAGEVVIPKSMVSKIKSKPIKALKKRGPGKSKKR